MVRGEAPGDPLVSGMWGALGGPGAGQDGWLVGRALGGLRAVASVVLSQEPPQLPLAASGCSI